MQWWNEFLSWFGSVEGRRVFTTAVIPFVAIVVSGVVAALIARSTTRRVLTYHDRELKAAAVTALIGAGRKATIWSSLGGEEKQHVDNQMSESDIRIRLLPVNGTNAAADWAAHEIAAMKKNSANFSFQAEQTFVDYRDRLLEWQNKPKRARKLFAFDLEQWRFDDEAADKALLEKQQQWTAKQASEKAAAAAENPAAPAALEGSSAPEATSAPSAPLIRPAFATALPATQNAEPATSTLSSSVETSSDSSEMSGDSSETSHSADHAHDNTADAADDAYTSEIPADGDESYAPPVTAGTVRRRTDPDSTPDAEHGSY
jgi:hypothetical protein